MNDKLEQSEENQLIEKSEQSNGKQSQLIEIYKLQAQLANSISSRRITINRFYILVMSGLALMFPTFFRLPAEVQRIVSSEYLIIGLPLLGITLSLAWFILINSNLRLSMIKYEALKNLEDKLEYQFFKDERRLLNKYGKNKTYGETSYFEIVMPILFFIIFTILLHLASANFPNKPYSKLTYYPGVVIGAFSFGGLRSWQVDREIRGMGRWADASIISASGVVLLIFMCMTIFIPKFMGCSEVVIEEAVPVNGQPAKTNFEKPAGKKTILPDENQADSVDENPVKTDSEETTKDQAIQPNEKNK